MKTNSKAYSTAVYADNIDDIIFEGRNHKYGAFYLRTHYKNHLLSSLLAVIAFALIVVGVPHLRAILFPKIAPPTVERAGGIIIIDPGPTTPPPPAPQPDVFRQIASKSKFAPPLVVDSVTSYQKDIAFLTDELEEPEFPYSKNNILIPFTVGDRGNEGVIDELDVLESYEVTEQAIFTQGSFQKWLGDNIEYPQEAIEAGISGKVVLKFTIDEKGRVSNVVVERSLHPLLDEAAVAAVLKSPKWTPAKHNGNKVKVFYRVPLFFKKLSN